MTEEELNVKMQSLLNTDAQQLLQVAEEGDMLAQYVLALRQKRGYKIALDKEAAMRWMQASADQGFVKAAYQMGMAYEIGSGVPCDENKALAYYRICMQAGDQQGQHAYEKLLEKQKEKTCIELKMEPISEIQPASVTGKADDRDFLVEEPAKTVEQRNDPEPETEHFQVYNPKPFVISKRNTDYGKRDVSKQETASGELRSGVGYSLLMMLFGALSMIVMRNACAQSPLASEGSDVYMVTVLFVGAGIGLLISVMLKKLYQNTHMPAAYYAAAIPVPLLAHFSCGFAYAAVTGVIALISAVVSSVFRFVVTIIVIWFIWQIIRAFLEG